MPTHPNPPTPPEAGRCRACGQQLLRSADDCWHPHDVAIPCPPEGRVDGIPTVAWGDGFGRPGRDMWIPSPPLADPVLPPLTKPEPYEAVFAAGLPVEVDASLPPNTIEIRSGHDSRYIRLDVPEPQPEPLTYLRALEWVYQALVDHRIAGGTDQPARIELHPESLEDLLIDADPWAIVPAPGAEPKLRGIPLQGDPRVPTGEVRVIWT